MIDPDKARGTALDEAGALRGVARMSVNIDDAIITILRNGAKVRATLLDYFHEDEHGAIGRRIDALTVEGKIQFDGTFYRWPPRKTKP